MRIALNELYHSVKGEGLWTGTPMCFVRLAGCTVGKPLRDDFALAEPGLATLFSGKQDEKGLPILKMNRPAWQCTTYDGRKFWCDTDFNKWLEMTPDEILSHVYEDRICLTGGEPLMHEEWVDALLALATARGKWIHIETSGTIYRRSERYTWIACAPKLNYLSAMINEADEIKLLVDKDFDINTIPEEVNEHPLVWLQPINNELGIRPDNLHLCLELLRDHPGWRLSPQVHKLIGVR